MDVSSNNKGRKNYEAPVGNCLHGVQLNMVKVNNRDSVRGVWFKVYPFQHRFKFRSGDTHMKRQKVKPRKIKRWKVK